MNMYTLMALNSNRPAVALAVWPSTLSRTMYLLISFRKSTPPQNRQLNTSIGDSKQYVDNFVGS